MSDFSRLGVSPSHRGPPQWPWGRPSGWPLEMQHPVNSGDHFPTSVLVENNPQKSSICPKLPNLAGPQACQNINRLTACCLILGLGRSCTSALGNTKTDRERTSRRGDGAYSEKAWTGRGRLQDRDKQKHTATSARIAQSQKTKGKGLGLPMNPGSEVIVTLP